MDADESGRLECCGSVGPGHRAVCRERPADPYGDVWISVEQLMVNDVLRLPSRQALGPGRRAPEMALLREKYLDDTGTTALVVEPSDRDGNLTGEPVGTFRVSRGAGVQIANR